jgi:membrane protein implicated in regulation of membrane protease activity
MITFLQDLHWWHWWILAAVLAALETLTSGVLAIWFAASAVIVGASLLIVPIPWQLQLVLFAVLGVVGVILYRRFRHPESPESEQAPLNQRSQHYVGQLFTLVEPIQGGSGKIRVGDTVWLVQGGDAPAGSRVRVIGVNGTVLRVDAIHPA